MAKIPEKNVIDVSNQMKEDHKKNLKVISIVMAAVAVILGVNSVYIMIKSPSMQDVLFQWILGFVAIFAVIYFLVYLCVCGIIKIQFNSALKEGYPELYKEHKI